MDYSGTSFDTILLLMNGAGLIGPLSVLESNLLHLKSLLNPGGQLLIDSTDISYMYDRTAEGGILVPADRYYGDLEFMIRYKGMEEGWSSWLYIDPRLFRVIADSAGFGFEVVCEGPDSAYLARLYV